MTLNADSFYFLALIYVRYFFCSKTWMFCIVLLKTIVTKSYSLFSTPLMDLM